MPQQTYTERVLIVLHPDGSFKGGHSEDVSTVTNDNGIVIAATQLPPRPLEEASLSIAFGSASAKLAAQVLSLNVSIQSRNDRISALEASLAQATLEKSNAEQQRDTEAAARDTLAAEASGLRAEIARLNSLLSPIDPAGNPVLTSVQVRLGLLAAGISPASVEASINVIPNEQERETIRAYWEYSTSFRKTHPLIPAVASALGLTNEQIDQMWAHAATLGG